MLNQFFNLIETLFDPVFGIDQKGIIRSLNHRAVEVFGLLRSASIGKKFSDLIVSPLHHKKLEEELEKANKKEENIGKEFEIMAHRSDGTQCLVQVAISAIHFHKIHMFYVFMKDISKKNFTFNESKKLAEQYHLLVNNIEDYAIYDLDSTGIIKSWNTGGELIYGYTSEEVLGKHFSIFYIKEDIYACKPQLDLKIALLEGKLAQENWRVKKEGIHFWSHNVIIPFWDESNKLKGFAEITKGIKKEESHKN